VNAGAFSVRRRGTGDLGSHSIEKTIALITEEIKNKKTDN
jgi:threonyl-tRNA synthetase